MRASPLFLLLLLPVVFSAGIPDSVPLADIYLREAYEASLNGNDNRARELLEHFFHDGKESAYSRFFSAQIHARLGDLEGAEKEARHAIELDPTVPRYFLILSEILAKEKKNHEALEVLEQARGRFPEQGEVEFYLAESLNQAGRSDEARIHYRQALFHLDSGSVQAHAFRSIASWRLAMSYLAANNREKALVHLLRYEEANPDRLYAAFLLGHEIYFHQGKLRRAQEQFQKILAAGEEEAVRQKVDLFAVYSASGEIAFLNRDPAAAVFLRRAVQLRKDDILDSGLLHILLGNKRSALNLLLTYAREHPDNLFARYGLLQLLKDNPRQDVYESELRFVAMLASSYSLHHLSIKLYAEAIRLKRTHPSSGEEDLSRLLESLSQEYGALAQMRRSRLYALQALAHEEEKKKDPSDGRLSSLRLYVARLADVSNTAEANASLVLCDRVIETNAESSMAYFTKGLILLEMERYTDSLKAFHQAIELDPDNVVFYFYRSLVYDRAGDFKNTEKDLLFVLEKKPDYAEAANHLGYLYAERGIENQRALELIQKAVDISPTNGAYQDSLGWVYYRMEDYEKARYHIQLASLILAEEEKEDPVVYSHLGDVYEKLNYPLKSLISYRKALFLLEKRTKLVEGLRVTDSGRQEDRKLAAEIREKIDRLTIKTGS